jgi:hypothetical protein
MHTMSTRFWRKTGYDKQGPAKGFDFDESMVEQIFDLLLREKQLKLPEGHKFPTA